MLSNKIKIIILVIILLFAVIFIYNISKDNSSVESETETITTIDESQIKYDEDTGEYYIQNEETGEITHTSYDEKELEIYTVDPDYEAWDPDKTDDEDIDNYEE